MGNSILPWLFGAAFSGGGKDFLLGTGNKTKQLPTGTPEQMQFGGQDLIAMLQQMSQQGGGFNLANQYDKSLLSGDPEAYNQFAAPYLQQFKEQIIPQIEERYAGAGALSSSGFGQSLGGAASGLQSNLAQLFTQLQGQAAERQQGQFKDLSSIGLNYSPFAYNEKQGKPAYLPIILSAMMKSGMGA